MIKQIQLENFKAIKSRQTIELKPITLFYGANSSGKSTVIQALNFMRELLEQNDGDKYGERIEGRITDMGGFHSIIHNHDSSLPLIIRLEAMHNEGYSLSDIEFLPYYTSFTKNEDQWLNEENPPILDFEFSDRSERKFIRKIYDIPESTFIEVTVEWSTQLNRPVISKYVTGFDNDYIGVIEPVTIIKGISGKNKYDNQNKYIYNITDINYNHAIFNNSNKDKDLSKKLFEWILSWSNMTPKDYDPEKNLYEVLIGFHSCLPQWGQMNHYDFTEEVEDYLDHHSIKWLIPEFLAAVFTAPGEYILSELRKIKSVGPLRSIPPRVVFSDKKESDNSMNELSYWNYIIDMHDLNIDLLNGWLNKIFATPYRIEILDFGSKFKTPKKSVKQNKYSAFGLLNHKQIVIHDVDHDLILTPKDVGTGISQVIPVLVGVINNENYMLTIEQPELHLHPKMQMALADLFIFQNNRWPNNMFLVETHSEHLILRLLRRVEETRSGINWEKASKELDRIRSNRKTNLKIEELYKIKSDRISVNWFEIKDEGLEITVLPIEENGEFSRNWPQGFFEEREDELFR